MSEKIKLPKIGGVYRHFKKGVRYTVENIARREDDDIYVIYRKIGSADRYVRPLDDFFANVEDHNKNKTGQIYRFEEVDTKEELNLFSTEELIEEVYCREDTHDTVKFAISLCKNDGKYEKPSFEDFLDFMSELENTTFDTFPPRGVKVEKKN